MKIETSSKYKIEHTNLDGPSVVICLADSRLQLANIQDKANVVERLDVIFNDASETYQQVRSPTLEDARTILNFVERHRTAERLIVQCQVGLGRSVAVMAALAKIDGNDPKQVLQLGTYNRRLYQLMLTAAHIPIEAEPLVSMAVRVKYPPDRLRMFLLSMRRQRYDNWEVVAVTDGPNPPVAAMVAALADSRVRLIESAEARGYWGNSYRQTAIDACRGEFLCITNDDNYYVPGFIEQMAAVLADGEMATCLTGNGHQAWDRVTDGSEIGSWLIRTRLARQVPWPDSAYDSARRYLISLFEACGAQGIKIINRPLYFHN